MSAPKTEIEVRGFLERPDSSLNWQLPAARYLNSYGRSKRWSRTKNAKKPSRKLITFCSRPSSTQQTPNTLRDGAERVHEGHFGGSEMTLGKNRPSITSTRSSQNTNKDREKAEAIYAGSHHVADC
ncbi:hypothetical protein CR513_05641, partial [Mucuna pruriens]